MSGFIDTQYNFCYWTSLAAALQIIGRVLHLNKTTKNTDNMVIDANTPPVPPAGALPGDW